MYSPHEIAYIENTLKQVIEELKRDACLRPDFQFDTKAEREAYAEQLIDDFLSRAKARDTKNENESLKGD